MTCLLCKKLAATLSKKLLCNWSIDLLKYHKYSTLIITIDNFEE